MLGLFALAQMFVYQFIVLYKLFCRHFGAAPQPSRGRKSSPAGVPLDTTTWGHQSLPRPPECSILAGLTSQFSSAGRGLRGYFISSHKLVFKLLSGCHIWFRVHHATLSDFFSIFPF